MRIDYLYLPELADKRHVVVDGRRTVNTAAKASNIIYLIDKGRVQSESTDKRARLSAGAVLEFVDDGRA